MNVSEVESIQGCRLLSRSARGRGNLLFLFGESGDARVLKLYRRRRSWRAQLTSGWSHRLLERKRGVTPRARFETERLTLDLWEKHGFDVFRQCDLPLPPDIAPPGLWLEYCPGRTLRSVLCDEEVGLTDGEVFNSPVIYKPGKLPSWLEVAKKPAKKKTKSK